MTLLLILLMVLFAAAGGFLGDFLELAGIVILVLAVVGPQLARSSTSRSDACSRIDRRMLSH